MSKVTLLAIIGIVFLGGFLRLYSLTVSPPSLNWDEVSIGYNSYSILKTGRDEYGAFLPITSRSFDEYKSAIPMYLSAATIAFTGPTVYGVRLPSTILSTLSIIFVYLIAVQLFKRRSIALTAAFLYAIEPWAVFYTRGAYHEASIALTFFLIGLCAFLAALKRPVWLPLAAFFSVLSMLTYNSNKVFVPLFFLGVIGIYRKQIFGMPRKVLIATLVTFVIVCIPFAITIIDGTQFARAKSAGVMLLWPHLVTGLQSQHALSQLIDFLVHNPLYYLSWEIGGRYIAAFSPVSLFLRESTDIGSVIPGLAVLYPFELPFYVIGLYLLFKYAREYKMLLLLLLIGPVAASVSIDWFHPGRSMLLLFVFTLLVAWGLITAFDVTSQLFRRVPLVRPVLISGFVLTGLVYAFYLFDSLFTILPYRDFANWQPGFQESVPKVMQLAPHYDNVVVSTGQAKPYIFYLYDGDYPPAQYHQDQKRTGNGTEIVQFGKFDFRKIDWSQDKNLPNTLFVGDGRFFPDNETLSKEGFVVYDEIEDLHGYIATKIVGRPVQR